MIRSCTSSAKLPRAQARYLPHIPAAAADGSAVREVLSLPTFEHGAHRVGFKAQGFADDSKRERELRVFLPGHYPDLCFITHSPRRAEITRHTVLKHGDHQAPEARVIPGARLTRANQRVANDSKIRIENVSLSAHGALTADPRPAPQLQPP